MTVPTTTNIYSNEYFLKAAEREKLSLQEIDAFKKYLQKLQKNNVPPILDEQHLSELVGYETTTLYAISNAPKLFYREFHIPKKTGGRRKINEPLPTLKEIQRFVLDEILKKIPISRASKAFSLKSNIKKNARIHLRQKTILKIDIKDFFPSIKTPRIYILFYELGYTKQLAMLLAKICCLNDSLPQGASTSPALANIICKKLDEDLLAACEQHSLRYTRYADDITISGVEIRASSIRLVRKIIKFHQFELNERKTAVLRDGARKIVTGIVVNEQMRAPRETRRKFRQNVYYIRKYGLDGHTRFIEEKRKSYLLHIIGVGEFIKWIGTKNEKFFEDIRFLKSLLANKRR